MTPNDDEQQRWRDLAEQLGLPPEPAAETTKASSADVAKAEAGPSSTPGYQPSAEALPEPPSWHEDVPEVTETRHKHGDARVSRGSIPTEEERPPSRGRGRGRRGRRSADARSTEGAKMRSEGEEGASADPDGSKETTEVAPTEERSRRRTRGRGRRGKATHDESDTPPVVDEPEQENLVSAPEDDDDDADDMSGWSIPSWQDLIDSLYRPDR
jgi:hypothetical protein